MINWSIHSLNCSIVREEFSHTANAPFFVQFTITYSSFFFKSMCKSHWFVHLPHLPDIWWTFALHSYTNVYLILFEWIMLYPAVYRINNNNNNKNSEWYTENHNLYTQYIGRIMWTIANGSNEQSEWYIYFKDNNSIDFWNLNFYQTLRIFG